VSSLPDDPRSFSIAEPAINLRRDAPPLIKISLQNCHKILQKCAILHTFPICQFSTISETTLRHGLWQLPAKTRENRHRRKPPNGPARYATEQEWFLTSSAVCAREAGSTPASNLNKIRISNRITTRNF
jgi:hypothetical protein